MNVTAALIVCLALTLAGCASAPRFDDQSARRPDLGRYVLVDPFSPAWTIDVHETGESRLRLEMALQRLNAGGEGEASAVFHRSARQLSRESGYQRYDVLWYEEGIDSGWPFSGRVARGEIQLIRAETPVGADGRAVPPYERGGDQGDAPVAPPRQP